MDFDHLFCAKRRMLHPFELFQVGVVKYRDKIGARFGYDMGKQGPLALVHIQDLVFEERHRRVAAFKADDHQVRGGRAIGCDSVKFVGLVKDDVAPLQRQAFVVCRHLHLSFVHAQKFPEAVGFPGEDKVAHIFEIVDADDPFNLKFFLKFCHFISHDCLLTPGYGALRQKWHGSSVCFYCTGEQTLLQVKKGLFVQK